MFVEICLEGVESAITASKNGADRIELCANLLEGGTTPSYGTISLARELVQTPINVMIRPRGGDFLYSTMEFEEMKRDIQTCKSIRVNGVVFGLLLSDGSIDTARTGELLSLAKPELKVTFHRAFDVCRDPFQALDELERLGVDRILSSGQEASVLEGLPLLNQLFSKIKKEKKKIVLMPGCGINERNMARILKELDESVTEIHMALPKLVDSGMKYRTDRVFMGVALTSSEYSQSVTSGDLVMAVKGL